MKRNLAIVALALFLAIGFLFFSGFEKLFDSRIFGKSFDEDNQSFQIFETEEEYNASLLCENQEDKCTEEHNANAFIKRQDNENQDFPIHNYEEFTEYDSPEYKQQKDVLATLSQDETPPQNGQRREVKRHPKGGSERPHNFPRKRHRFFDSKRKPHSGRRKWGIWNNFGFRDKYFNDKLAEEVNTDNFCGSDQIPTSKNQKPETLDVEYGNVTAKDAVNKIAVKGIPVNSQYYDNIVIEIYGADNTLMNTIRPKTDLGYEPDVILADFMGNGLSQIFLGINSGGSGGFGYFYIFDAQNNEIKTIFDYEEYSKNNQYTGKYLDYYRAFVTKTDASEKYAIDLTLRPKDYIDMIWDSNGKLIKPVEVFISGVNTVFPYYNYTSHKFELLVYQRVTGLYSADGLGYVMTQLTFSNGIFTPFYNGLMVFSN